MYAVNVDVNVANTVVALLIGFGTLMAGVWKAFTVIRRTLDRIEAPVQQELTTNGGGSLLDKVNTLTTRVGEVTQEVAGVKSDVGQVRSDLTSQHSELTEHIADVKHKASKLEREAESTSASWIKYVFEHRSDHRAIHAWLAQHGIDRRTDDQDAQ